MTYQQERWATRIGLVLAMAGNAVGLGNFLRFPVQAAQNGGGAFMIPYLIALLVMGFPLMWLEWAIGRHGGAMGQNSTVGMFDKITHLKIAKYLGILGVFIPFTIIIYYMYIESWCLGYAFFSLTGKYFGIFSRAEMSQFLSSFQGTGSSPHFSGVWVAYLFYLVTFGLNMLVLSRGIAKGIEILAKICMPLIALFAIILLVRVVTLGTPDPNNPEQNIYNGFGFLWNPNFAELNNAKIWLAAAGQVFFTLSLGMGAIPTFASYVKKKDDIALNAVATAATNETAEVVLGGSIAIPVAFAFFGLTETIAIAQGGAFDLGFQSLPIIFQKLPIGQIFGFIWFFLLFIAGLTSSVALLQPAIAFFENELNLPRKKAVTVIGITQFLCAQPVIFCLGHGFLDEMDYWVGTLLLVVVALIEIIFFMWLYKGEHVWEELKIGADLKVPKIFYFIVKYVTPIYLIVLLCYWFYKDGIGVLMMQDVSSEDAPFRWMARTVMLALIVGMAVIIWTNPRRKKGEISS